MVETACSPIWAGRHPGHTSCGIAIGPNQGFSDFKWEVGEGVSEDATNNHGGPSGPSIIAIQLTNDHSNVCEANTHFE